ncbi:MAG TPA: T9SS type A sorting domain-containing protein [Chitinophagales bacterium]|nr:T9SS type A sorting domain-containing protein [Chitinophagales bacterium]
MIYDHYIRRAANPCKAMARAQYVLKMNQAALFTICFLLEISNAFSQAGILDSTFGINGISNCLPGGAGCSVAIQTDGKIVVGGCNHNGHFALARFESSGLLDSTFSSDGVVELNLGPNSCQKIAIQSDGKILEGGTDGTLFGLARFNIDGTLDISFSGNGTVSTSLNDSGYASYSYGLTIQPDDKIIQVGESWSNSGIMGFAVARFNTDGSLDNSFGTGGKVLTPIGNALPYATCAVVQPDGKILIGGTSWSATGSPSCFALARYNSNGTLDVDFGVGGKVTTYFGAGDANDYDTGLAIALQSDGKIVMTGTSYINGTDTLAKIPIVRYNADGSLDNSFGVDGKVSAFFPSHGYYEPSSIAVQQDQKIVIAGTGTNSPSIDSKHDFLLSRFNTNGSLDSSFGSNGIVITAIDSTINAINSLCLQQDGKIIVAGISYMQGMVVARYLSGLNVGVINLAISNNPTLIYPNPIQSEATLQYTLTNEECISISLYNMQGSKVQTFLTNETRNQGEHKEVLHLDGALPLGNYILDISNGVHSQGISIIKQ